MILYRAHKSRTEWYFIVHRSSESSRRHYISHNLTAEPQTDPSIFVFCFLTWNFIVFFTDLERTAVFLMCEDFICSVILKTHHNYIWGSLKASKNKKQSLLIKKQSQNNQYAKTVQELPYIWGIPGRWWHFWQKISLELYFFFSIWIRLSLNDMMNINSISNHDSQLKSVSWHTWSTETITAHNA